MLFTRWVQSVHFRSISGNMNVYQDHGITYESACYRDNSAAGLNLVPFLLMEI